MQQKHNIRQSSQLIFHPSLRHNIYNSIINKQTHDTYNDHLYIRKSRNGRYKSIGQYQNPSYFAQISALNVQNIYAAVNKKQTNRKNNQTIIHLTKSLNGTWFKNTAYQTYQFVSSSLYNTLTVRKRSHERRKKSNPEMKELNLEQEYKEPNFFPARPSTSLNLYSSNQRKLAKGYNSFRSVQLEGKGLGVNQNGIKNQGWLKGQIIKNVEAKIQNKSRKSKVKTIANLNIKQAKQRQQFVLISKKAKINI